MIYATDPEWLATLYPPEPGTVYIMSEDGICCATCFLGSLTDQNGVPDVVPEGLEELQRRYCTPRPVLTPKV